MNQPIAWRYMYSVDSHRMHEFSQCTLSNRNDFVRERANTMDPPLHGMSRLAKRPLVNCRVVTLDWHLASRANGLKKPHAT